MDHSSDFLVIGSGIAGLSTALKLASLGTVHVVTKKEAAESNTNYAQGGIAAAVDPDDSLESHAADTLKAGAGLCREDVVRRVVADGPARVRELGEVGVRFSEKEGRLDLGLEGGHFRRRVLHAGDFTGREIEQALIRACRQSPRIRIFEDHMAADLILADDPAKTPIARNRCWGAYVLETKTGEVHSFRAKATVLASGGAGRVYLYTSNPDVATGCGMAMAYRAGAALANLEFVQFHPTCLYNPGVRDEQGRRFLLSEAMRGEGGILLRKDGTRLMEDLHPLEDLAPRDIVARAIDAELKRSGDECVFLDMSAKPREFLEKRFPNIFTHCLWMGIDPSKQPVPVVPAAHFFCGGVETDSDGATRLPGLYAVGECAHTGLHGANRLASNSLLEGLVFAERAFGAIEKERTILEAKVPAADPWKPIRAAPGQEAVFIRQDWDEIRRLVWNFVGIVRTDRRLNSALERIRIIRREVMEVYRGTPMSRDLVELRNVALLAELIISSAISRRESRGLHYNLDHPEPVENERKDTFLSRYGPYG
ncbi:MAG: L-aspartate oxidase [Elusimicrobia bacterium]|nr:L-aspartate oxidase [Elusimicrobiota bacterium]